MNPRISELFDELDFMTSAATNINAGSLFASESIKKKILIKTIDNLSEIDIIVHSLKPKIPEPWASMSADEIIKGLGVYK
ncbi:hypothetical protein EFL44_10750 [Lactococcus cremoris]|uniref:ORF25 n=1 Tax=Lactococcus phage TP901-1C TaxID=343949 RepID=Q2QES0_9CAUD|nr:hypothetical protein [Lactococcus cremoris]NP_112688.1 ORF25 [Lactococcus phage TP901-1]AAK38042.1 ORF25 [Lactococcus phage TP901-1]AAZ99222.1 ORF25 [Lactococcus phage TP901-1C]MCT0467523.1 hypothetical protein [Lactococcus cremoris]